MFCSYRFGALSRLPDRMLRPMSERFLAECSGILTYHARGSIGYEYAGSLKDYESLNYHMLKFIHRNANSHC